MIDYTPPSTNDLAKLKEQLGMTGEQMAELASVAGGQQWRKYTGGADPRSLGLHMCFFMAARLALSPNELAKVAAKMRDIGAEVGDLTLDADANLTNATFVGGPYAGKSMRVPDLDTVKAFDADAGEYVLYRRHKLAAPKGVESSHSVYVLDRLTPQEANEAVLQALPSRNRR